VVPRGGVSSSMSPTADRNAKEAARLARKRAEWPRYRECERARARDRARARRAAARDQQRLVGCALRVSLGGDNFPRFIAQTFAYLAAQASTGRSA